MSDVNVQAPITKDDFLSPSLLPPPLRNDLNRRALETVHAERLADIDVAAIVTMDYDNVPAAVLPALAEQSGLLGDAGWDYAGYGSSPEAKKRQLLRQAIPMQARRGTRGAVEDSLAVLNLHARITEWFEQSPAGVPYTFEINANIYDQDADMVLDAQRISQIQQVVKYWKNVRSSFILNVEVGMGSTLNIASIAQSLSQTNAVGEVDSFKLATQSVLTEYVAFSGFCAMASAGTVQ